MANMVEGGDTPVLAPARLEALGYRIAAYPLTLLNVAVGAMNRALVALRDGRPPEGMISFPELRQIVGFDDYDRDRKRYSDDA